MLEIAGLALTGLSTIKDMIELFGDLTSWKEDDLLVDDEWLGLAIQAGLIDQAEYAWSAERSVPTRELKGSHAVVTAYNDTKKLKYRIVRGHGADRAILVKISNATTA